MMIIFSPTKTLKKTENKYECTTPQHLDIASEIDMMYNVIKSDSNQALFFYNGISFKYLDVTTLNDNNINYLNNHLIILSALYGMLKPLDLINEYRLDFTNKQLYEYWNLYIDDVVINLASLEYSKMVKCKKVINIEFKEYKNNKLTVSGTYNKMLRGLMLRYLTVNNIEDINLIKEFNELEYSYNEELSKGNTLVFCKGNYEEM